MTTCQRPCDARDRQADYGHWSGRALEDVQRDDPDAVAAWLTDPDAAPRGGAGLEPLSGEPAAAAARAPR